VLELACGTGACTEILGKICKGGEIIALDRSETMIHFAKENIRSAGISNVSFVIGDAIKLSTLLPNEKFDFAICNSAFWHFSEVPKVLTDLRLLLNNRGQFGFNIPLWFPSEEARLKFRKSVVEIFQKYGIAPPKSGSLRNQLLDYSELLQKSGFNLIRDEAYEIEMSAGAREDWRDIPAFREPQYHSSEIPIEVLDEIRQEFEKLQKVSQDGKNSQSKMASFCLDA
jgi:ubiquinone/menaquinone biosynthesis C-methylase UbiE